MTPLLMTFFSPCSSVATSVLTLVENCARMRLQQAWPHSALYFGWTCPPTPCTYCGVQGVRANRFHGECRSCPISSKTVTCPGTSSGHGGCCTRTSLRSSSSTPRERWQERRRKLLSSRWRYHCESVPTRADQTCVEYKAWLREALSGHSTRDEGVQ